MYLKALYSSFDITGVRVHVHVVMHVQYRGPQAVFLDILNSGTCCGSLPICRAHAHAERESDPLT